MPSYTDRDTCRTIEANLQTRAGATVRVTACKVMNLGLDAEPEITRGKFVSLMVSHFGHEKPLLLVIFPVFAPAAHRRQPAQRAEC